MAADADGNDITLVGVPITGFVGIGPAGTTLPADDEGGVDPLDPVLNVAIKKVGLLKTDGGPGLLWAPKGDPLEFWQSGYDIPSGDADVTLTISLAEVLGNWARTLKSGAAPTVDKMITVDGGGHATKYVIWVEEIFKNGAIRRTAIKNAGILTWTEDKSARGAVQGATVVFKVPRDNALGAHFREWVVPAA